MFLGSSDRIRENFARLLETHNVDEPIAIAVAFWGAGAEALLPPGQRFRLICNLSMAGTNPAVIEALMSRDGTEVHHLSDLHAKVIVASGGALVSSANFSANGLGLEGRAGDGWQEAGVLIPADDPEFAKVYAWFEQRWNVSPQVDAIAIEQARKDWSARTTRIAAAHVDEPAPNPTANVAKDSSSELHESDLFQPVMKPRNALRMAADWLVDEYRVMRGGTLSTSDYYIPAYAAYALWTLAGNRMATNIRTTPEFSRPEQVFRRAEERGQDNPDRVRNLIARVGRSTAAPMAVKHWARQWIERNP